MEGVPDEMPLAGGWVNSGVVRVGHTVRRPPSENVDFVQRLLVHLEQVGFDRAPRFLGFDDQEREMLTFIEGDTFSDCRSILWTDRELSQCAQLLRRFHDATVGTQLAGDAEVVCHNDYGPWNLVWRRGKPIALFDFDESAPGDRVADVGYAVWKFLNLGVLSVSPEEQARRLSVFIGTYGDLSADAVVGAAIAAQDRMERKVQDSEEAARRVRTERCWLAANSGILAGGQSLGPSD
jgi:hypothetical protein